MQLGSVRRWKDGRGSGNMTKGALGSGGSLPRLDIICAAVGVIAVGALLWLFGLTWRTGIAIAIFVACPIIVVWVLLRAGRKGRIQPETDG